MRERIFFRREGDSKACLWAGGLSAGGVPACGQVVREVSNTSLLAGFNVKANL